MSGRMTLKAGLSVGLMLILLMMVVGGAEGTDFSVFRREVDRKRKCPRSDVGSNGLRRDGRALKATREEISAVRRQATIIVLTAIADVAGNGLQWALDNRGLVVQTLQECAELIDMSTDFCPAFQRRFDAMIDFTNNLNDFELQMQFVGTVVEDAASLATAYATMVASYRYSTISKESIGNTLDAIRKWPG